MPFDVMKPIEDAEQERWAALVKLAEAVRVLEKLPEDAPRAALNDWLGELECEYVAAYARYQGALADS